MIQVKMKDLIGNIEVLKKLSQKPLKGRVAYNIGKILQQVENEINLFAGARQNLIQQYVNKDENGDPQVNPENNEFIFSGDNMSKFVDEIGKVLDTTVDIDANKILLEDLGENDFTPTEMLALEPFIEE